MRRWGLLIIFFFLLIITMKSVASCNNNGNCEPSEVNEFPACYDCNNPTCGDTYCISDDGETCDNCAADCGYCNGHVCSYNGECQSRYCVCGVCDDQPPADYCCSDADCPIDTYDDWSAPYCYLGDVYHWRYFYDNYCPGQGEACAQTVTTQREKLVECGDKPCLDGSCCTPEASFSCDASENDIYYFDSCGIRGAVKEDCQANDHDGAWGTPYCKNGDVWHNRTLYRGGCGEGDTTCTVQELFDDDHPSSTVSGAISGISGSSAECFQ